MLELIIIVAIVAALAWLVIRFVPMPEPFRAAAIIIFALWLVLYVLEFFGLTNFGIGRSQMIQLLVIIVVFGVIVWFITKYLPLPDVAKQVIYVLAVIGLIILIVQFLGITDFGDGGWRHNRP